MIYRIAGPLSSPDKLRYQAVFIVGPMGSGKSFVSERWLKYMPGEGQGRNLTPLSFSKIVSILKKHHFQIELVNKDHAKIPFILHGKYGPIHPSDWRHELEPEIYEQVKNLRDIVFSTPKHELESYWRQASPDVFKNEIPGYSEKNPSMVHEMSRTMSNAYLSALLDTGDPVIVEGTGRSYSMSARQINEAKAKGYRVSLVYVYVPLVIAHIRNATRSRNTPPYILTKGWFESKEKYPALRKLAHKSKVIINRNDSEDLKKYWMYKEKIDSVVKAGYRGRYESLYELIADIKPDELRLLK